MKKQSTLFGDDFLDPQGNVWPSNGASTSKKRKSDFGNKSWSQIIEEKRQEFSPSQKSQKAIRKSTPTASQQFKDFEAKIAQFSLSTPNKQKSLATSFSTPNKRKSLATSFSTPNKRKSLATSFSTPNTVTLEGPPAKKARSCPRQLQTTVTAATKPSSSSVSKPITKVQNWIETNHLYPEDYPDETIEDDSPSKYQYIQCDTSSSSEDEDEDEEVAIVDDDTLGDECKSQSQHLSSQISEDTSTRSKLSNEEELDSATPIGDWIHMGKSRGGGVDTDNIEICEFDSPKKSEKIMPEFETHVNTEQYSEQWTVVGGRRRKKFSLGEQLKGIVDRYSNSVKRFAHDYRLQKFDENKSMTLVIRYFVGREDKLMWAICRHIEKGLDRCVMFKPFYAYEIKVGVIIRVYQPWKELNLPGTPMPLILCTDFYRIGEKRDNYFGVSESMINELNTMPVPFKRSYVRVLGMNEGYFMTLVPFNIKNFNTISKQMKFIKPTINLDAVVYQITESDNILTLLCDSDNFFSILKIPETQKKRSELCHFLEPGHYLRFQNIGIISKTTILKNAALFSLFERLGSDQKYYYTLGIRHDTKWKKYQQLEIPYNPI